MRTLEEITNKLKGDLLQYNQEINNLIDMVAQLKKERLQICETLQKLEKL